MMRNIPAAIGLVGMLWFHHRKSSFNAKGGKGIRALSIATGNDTLDTVTMARIEREKNGPWEVELSYGGEADLKIHLIGCQKNPGHVNFIPVDQFIDQFKKEHLPTGYQDQDIVELVKAMSYLTVRVSVEYVSVRRPETVPGKPDKPYPCYKNRGSNFGRYGSGWVNSVRKFTNEGEKCECKECLSSEKPETNFAHIMITTATHVVYDELEGAHTTCHLFFDKSGTPETCEGVVTLSGMTRVRSDPNVDWCDMTYVTHDLDIIDKLHDMVVRYNTLENKIRNKHETRSYTRGPMSAARLPESFPVIIVSHPHGYSKQVSIGYTSGPYGSGNLLPFQYTFLYTTPTCPGSSGACVWVCNGYTERFKSAPHGGYWGEEKELNYSAAFLFYFPRNDNLTLIPAATPYYLVECKDFCLRVPWGTG